MQSLKNKLEYPKAKSGVSRDPRNLDQQNITGLASVTVGTLENIQVCGCSLLGETVGVSDQSNQSDQFNQSD